MKMIDPRYAELLISWTDAGWSVRFIQQIGSQIMTEKSCLSKKTWETVVLNLQL